ncbi:TPA: antitermination protein NusG [Klebsiella aerogenes]|nr:antitermination protein NusG [Klebsiella aerogenes]
MENWYLACHKAGRHNAYKAQMFLSQPQINATTFIPLMCLLRPRADRPGKQKRLIEPLFPGYMFIYFDPEVIPVSKIANCPGVSYLVRFADIIVPIHDKFVEEIMSLPVCTYAPVAKIKNAGTINNARFTDEQHKDIIRMTSVADGQERSALLYELTGRHFLKSLHKKE